MQGANNNHKSIGIILTIFFPFAGLIYTLSHWRESWAKNAFWLACIYMGAVLIFCPEGTILGSGADGGRYVLRLMDMYNNSSLSIFGIFSSFFQHDPEIMDLYQPLMNYFISRFTDNGHVMFAAYAFVFGFFYSRNIWYILEKLPNKKLGYLFILVTLYFLICPITQINGVRMWTALHVYVYGMMPYLLERDKSKIWFVALTPLIHFSFLYVAIFGLLWFALPYRFKSQNSSFIFLAYIFFLVSLFVNSLNMNMVEDMIVEYSPENYEEHLSGFIGEEYMENRAALKEQHNWYVGLSGVFTHWSYSILMLFLYPCLKRNFSKNTGLMHLFCFALLLGSFANIIALLPSGGRFKTLSQMFMVPLILMTAMSIPSTDVFKRVLNIAILFLVLPFVFNIRMLFDFFSITVVMGNFITVLFWENNVPLMDLIKRII